MATCAGTSSQHITVLGDIFCDIIASVQHLPDWGKDMHAPIRILPGGSGLNTVLHGANYAHMCNPNLDSNGVFFRFFSATGCDAQGDICHKVLNYARNSPGTELPPADLREHATETVSFACSSPFCGIENHVVQRSDYPTATCMVLSGPEDRTFMSSRGCIEPMSLAWFDQDEILRCSRPPSTALQLSVPPSALEHYNNAQNNNTSTTCTNVKIDAEESANKTAQCTDPKYVEGSRGTGANIANHLHISGYYNCTTLQKELPDFLHKAQRSGHTTSLNPQFDASQQWKGLREIAPYLDVLICSEGEALSIAAAGVDCAGNDLLRSNSDTEIHTDAHDTLNAIPSMSTAKAATVLLSWGIGCTVITLADRGVGAYYSKGFAKKFRMRSSHQTINNDSNEGCNDAADLMGQGDSYSSVTQNFSAVYHLHQSTAKNVQIVDTTGAGDAFGAGFLVSWINSGYDLKAALQAGCVTGACAVQLLGASTLPTAAMVQRVSEEVAVYG